MSQIDKVLSFFFSILGTLIGLGFLAIAAFLFLNYDFSVYYADAWNGMLRWSSQGLSVFFPRSGLPVGGFLLALLALIGLYASTRPLKPPVAENPYGC